MKTLLLVDGSSYLYRAFHALPDLRTAEGEPTGALRGFIAMLRTLRAQVPHDYCACVFDAKGKTFREDIYPQYKANRPPMPDDLARQIAPIHQAVAALGWPILEIEGIEADDVIGTLAREAEGRGVGTVISTGDKDLAQLVGDTITLVNTMSGERLDVDGVVAKFGVRPDQIVDYLTLVGDSVDNVPGVDKVGPKTAAKWIAEYGSLDAIVANADKIGGKVGENLRAALGWLPTARQLVTIRADGDLSVQLPPFDSLAVRPPDTARLRDLFKRWEFRTFLKELGDESAPPPEAETTAQDQAGEARTGYETVTTTAQLEHWIARINAAGLVAVDTETTSLDPMAARLVGISLAAADEHDIVACYVPLAHRYTGVPDQLPLEPTLRALRPWLESEQHKKVGQHLKYDVHVFANHGIRLAGIAHDTMLQSYVLEAHRSHNMDDLAERHLGHSTIKYEDVCGKGAGQIGFDEVALDRATEYAAEDAEVTLALHNVLWPRLEASEQLRFVYERLEMPVSRILFDMERTGVLVDRDRLATQSAEIARRLAELESRAQELAGQPFNLGSPKQIGEVLFGVLKLPVTKKTASGAPSTDEEVLEKLAEDYPLPKVLLEHRGLAKLKSTYCDKLAASVDPNTGRVHTS